MEDEERARTGTSVSSLKEPAKITNTPPYRHRLLVIVFIFLLEFGPSLGFPSFGSLYTQLKRDFGYSDAQLGFLFSIYSLPNTVVVLFAGVAVDYLGINACTLFCIAFFSIGFIITLGEAYMYLLIGRALYGLGMGCMGVVENTLVAMWYSKDTELTLSVTNSICLFCYRLSSLLSMVIVPMIYESYGFQSVLGGTVVLALGSALAGLVIVSLNKKYDSYLHGGGSSEVFELKNLQQLGGFFWLACLVGMTTYGCILPFISFSTEFIVNKWGLSDVNAGLCTSTLYFVALLVVLPVGFAVDKYGHRMSLLLLSTILPFIAYSTLLFTTVSPFVGCAILGIAHGIFPSLIYPLVALVVERRLMGTAYGILNSCINIGLFLSPFLLGFVNDIIGTNDSLSSHEQVARTNAYRVTGLLLLSVVGTVIAGSMWWVDNLKGGKLERPNPTPVGITLDEEESEKNK